MCWLWLSKMQKQCLTGVPRNINEGKYSHNFLLFAEIPELFYFETFTLNLMSFT